MVSCGNASPPSSNARRPAGCWSNVIAALAAASTSLTGSTSSRTMPSPGINVTVVLMSEGLDDGLGDVSGAVGAAQVAGAHLPSLQHAGDCVPHALCLLALTDVVQHERG